ncbi:MAG: ice-binding family protein [Cyclobacteriaceae bacterium]|nr:ice-binding family protein [Cyclobacteriaceae bacterium]
MKTKIMWMTSIVILFLAAVVAGCRDENVEKVGQCPEVVSTNPANLATGVAQSQVITVTFNGAIDPATITPDVLVILGTDGSGGRVSKASQVLSVLTYDAETFTMSYTPSVKLTANTTYTGTVSTAVKDPYGNALQVPYVWSFTTGAPPVPSVVSTIPANQAVNVPLTQVVSANFSEAMDPLTINANTFTLKTGATLVAGTVTYSGTTATFTPSSNLVSGTYTATITTDAKNVAGTAIAADKIWSFSTGTALGPIGVDLGLAENFGILAGVGVSNNAGFSEIHDLNVGISPGVRSSITGFPPAIIVNGSMFASDDSAPAGVAAMLTQAKQDLTDAYLFAEGATSPAPATVAGDQGGLTLAPGIYKSTSTLLIQSGDLTLDAGGDVNAVWIFQIASDFTTVGGAGGSVILSGGAQAKNVYWQTGSSATIGDGTSFKGNILALTSITMNAGAVAQGRMLARNGSVVMTSTNIINKP